MKEIKFTMQTQYETMKKWNEDYKKFIIARWGDELRSFPDLLKLARERKLQWFKNELAKAKVKIEAALQNPETSVNSHFAGEWVHFDSICL